MAGVSAGTSAAAAAQLGSNEVFDEALSALVNLGYQKQAAEKALQQVIKDGGDLNVQKLLRQALQRLAK
jgi:Holliday junction DNA helicase RuvA